jgi:hypothetical protein
MSLIICADIWWIRVGVVQAETHPTWWKSSEEGNLHQPNISISLEVLLFW